MLASCTSTFSQISFNALHFAMVNTQYDTGFTEQPSQKFIYHKSRETRKRIPLSPLDKTGWSVFAIHTRTESFSGRAKANFPTNSQITACISNILHNHQSVTVGYSLMPEAHAKRHLRESTVGVMAKRLVKKISYPRQVCGPVRKARL
jgi:hypothetical protein